MAIEYSFAVMPHRHLVVLSLAISIGFMAYYFVGLAGLYYSRAFAQGLDLQSLNSDHTELRREHAQVLQDHERIYTLVRDNQETINSVHEQVNLNSAGAIGMIGGNALISTWLLKSFRSKQE